MPTSHFRRIFKSSIILSVLFLFFSCEKDDVTEDIQSTKSEIENLIVENGGTIIKNQKKIDQVSRASKPIYFKSVAAFENFLKEQNATLNVEDAPVNGLYDFKYNYNGGSSEEGTAHVIRFIGGGVILNIHFRINNCSGSGITSYITGFTLGASYQHIDGDTTTNPGGGSITYNVLGVLNYNIVIEGIGTFYSKNVRYSGVVGCNN